MTIGNFIVIMIIATIVCFVSGYKIAEKYENKIIPIMLSIVIMAIILIFVFIMILIISLWNTPIITT